MEVRGVRRLKEFNFSLLDKWMLEERGSLWYNVLCVTYGAGGLCVGLLVVEGVLYGGKTQTILGGGVVC